MAQRIKSPYFLWAIVIIFFTARITVALLMQHERTVQYTAHRYAEVSGYVCVDAADHVTRFSLQYVIAPQILLPDGDSYCAVFR